MTAFGERAPDSRGGANSWIESMTPLERCRRLRQLVLCGAIAKSGEVFYLVKVV